MEYRIAKISSFVFHPLFIVTYAFVLLFNMNIYFSFVIPFSYKLGLLTVVFILTFALPAFVIAFFLARGAITSIYMETRKERILPFLITAVFYYVAFHILKQLELPAVFTVFILGATFLIIMALIISLWWKISVHMLGIGAMTGAFIGISLNFMIDIQFLISLIILCAGIIGFSRLKLNAHSPAQVYAGFLTGALFMLLLFLYL